MTGFECVDCQLDTAELEEYYMVNHALWLTSGLTARGGMLCIGCLEKRIGRTLTPDDFLVCPLNGENFNKSDRLLNRLGRE